MGNIWLSWCFGDAAVAALRLPHLENVRLSLAVVAREGRVHWPVDAPHVPDELWVTGENRLVIQFKEVLAWRGKEGDAGGS